MAEEPNKFTHIGIEKTSHKKIALLAKVKGANIYEMVGEWADQAWAQARDAGLVTDAMLEAQPAVHWVNDAEPIKVKSKKVVTA